jgi:hypothetical protein
LQLFTFITKQQAPRLQLVQEVLLQQDIFIGQVLAEQMDRVSGSYTKSISISVVFGS